MSCKKPVTVKSRPIGEDGQTGHVIDVVEQQNRGAGWVFLVAIIGVIPGFVLLGLMIALYGAAETIWAPIAVVAVLAGITVFVSVRKDRRRSRIIEDELAVVHDVSDLELRLARMLSRYRWSRDGGMDESIIRGIWSAGITNVTVRVSTKRSPPEFEPIPHRFEPQLLDEGSPGFEGLARLESRLSNVVNVATHQRERILPARLARNVRLIGGWYGVAGMGIILVFLGFELYRGRGISWLFLYLSLMTICGLLKGRWSILRPAQWFVVPGGLVRRNPARGRDGWNVKLFLRRDCVLIVRYGKGQDLAIHVTNGESCETDNMTNAELDLLLRGWTGLVEPPEVERLSDLVG